MSFLKKERSRVHSELSVTEGGKEGKSKLEVSNPHSKQRLKGFCRRIRDGQQH